VAQAGQIGKGRQLPLKKKPVKGEEKAQANPEENTSNLSKLVGMEKLVGWWTEEKKERRGRFYFALKRGGVFGDAVQDKA